MNKLTLKSHAKLNLYLSVVNKRSDNYHNINTVFERISLYDKIILKERPDKIIRIISDSSHIPKDNSNLARAAAEELRKFCGLKGGVDIEIVKYVPVGSGMGGGSSNAATVILGLNKLWGLNLSLKELTAIARKIGSDVPFFIYNSAFAQGLGRGDKIKPLKMPGKLKLWHILVVPKIKVSTPLIYKKWDLLFDKHKARLTKPDYNVKILLSALKKNDRVTVGSALFNSLEEITTQFYPEVARIKDGLRQRGLNSILMSGSGPAVFGIVRSRKEAVSLCRELKKQRSSWQIFAVSTR